MEALFDAGNALLDFLYPPRCYLCGELGSIVCEDCVAGWPRPEPPRCPLCANPLPVGACRWCGGSPAPLRAAAFPFAFAEGAREVVHLLKYGGKRRVAPSMAAEMARAVWDSPSFQGASVIVPVGLHPRRLRRRGYNQSEWLAHEISNLLNLPVGLWSIRERDTRPQVGLSREDRASNVSGAFKALDAAAGHRILLVDDVSTTGATAKEAARALKRAGAEWVALVTFARDL